MLRDMTTIINDKKEMIMLYDTTSVAVVVFIAMIKDRFHLLHIALISLDDMVSITNTINVLVDTIDEGMREVVKRSTVPAPVEVLTPASSRSEMAPVASGSALAPSTGVSFPLVDEDPLVLAVAPWSPDEAE